MLRISILLPLLLTGCPKKVDEPPPPPVKTSGDEAPKDDKKDLPAPVAQMVENFKKVFFEFDSAELSAEGKAALDANATIMGENSDITIEVQGHADERGTTEYNLALGQKRADAVVRYLLGRGVGPSRVKSVSYGEERPVDGRAVETAYEQNRRAEFAVTWDPKARVKGTTN